VDIHLESSKEQIRTARQELRETSRRGSKVDILSAERWVRPRLKFGPIYKRGKKGITVIMTGHLNTVRRGSLRLMSVVDKYFESHQKLLGARDSCLEFQMFLSKITEMRAELS
jgi:hypothetical protein